MLEDEIFDFPFWLSVCLKFKEKFVIALKWILFAHPTAINAPRILDHEISFFPIPGYLFLLLFHAGNTNVYAQPVPKTQFPKLDCNFTILARLKRQKWKDEKIMNLTSTPLHANNKWTLNSQQPTAKCLRHLFAEIEAGLYICVCSVEMVFWESVTLER